MIHNLIPRLTPKKSRFVIPAEIRRSTERNYNTLVYRGMRIMQLHQGALNTSMCIMPSQRPPFRKSRMHTHVTSPPRKLRVTRKLNVRINSNFANNLFPLISMEQYHRTVESRNTSLNNYINTYLINTIHKNINE